VQTEEEAKARAAELGVRLVYLGHMFWNELRWIRQRTGLSIEYLARQANVSVIAWQNAEAGRSETVPAQIEWCALDWAEKMSIPPYGTPEPVVTPAHLRAIRAKMKLSKSGLADRLNISSSALYQWESGGRKIPPYVLYALRKLNQAEGQKGEE
jgi:DNA-binding transcriptional regulator YiaG